MSEKAASLTSHVEKSVTDEAVNRESVYRNIVHHKVQLYDENGALNLVPTPSSDPNDPLRTPSWRKHLTLAAICLYTTGGMTISLSISSLLPALIEYYQRPYADVSPLGTYPIVFQGIGGTLSILGAKWLGTRPVLIFDSALTVASTIWAATSRGEVRGLYSHIAARCFICLGIGGAETLGPLILQDLNYIHTRNTQIAMIWAFSGVVSSAGGIASTYITAALNWRWFDHIINIISIIALILIVLFVPESSWARTESDLHGASPTDADGFATPVRPTGRAQSYLYSLRLVSEYASAAQAWECLKDIVRCTLFPNIIWIILLNSCLSGATIATQFTLGSLLESAYHWAPQNVGLFNIALIVSSFLTLPLSGYFGDWVIKTLAKRKHGAHRPEDQLVNMVVPLVIGFIGVVCYGIMASNPNGYHWITVLVVAGFQFFSSLAVFVASTTYAIECFPDLASPILITVGAYRNIIGFGLIQGSNAFVAKAGFGGCFGTYAGLVGFVGIVGIIFYARGETIRKRINAWSFRYSKAAIE